MSRCFPVRYRPAYAEGHPTRRLTRIPRISNTPKYMFSRYPSSSRCMQFNHVVGFRCDDAAQPGTPLHQCIALLVQIVVLVVNALDARARMREDCLPDLL